jgi:hypothetical protein
MGTKLTRHFAHHQWGTAEKMVGNAALLHTLPGWLDFLRQSNLHELNDQYPFGQAQATVLTECTTTQMA